MKKVLSTENIKTWPKEVNDETTCEELDLSHNRLSNIAVEASDALAQTLKRLNLRDNQFTMLPATIYNFVALQELDLSQNFHASNVQNKLPEHLPPNLTILKISKANLTSLPKAILQLTKLKMLDLSHNGQLQALPHHTMPMMQSLEILDLHFCGIHELHQFMLGPHLHQLKLSCNNLKHITATDLSMLRDLDMSRNHLSSIPPQALHSMTNMLSLSLSHNKEQIGHWKLDFSHLKQLQRLELSRLGLTVVPSGIHYDTIVHLDLFLNYIGDLTAVKIPDNKPSVTLSLEQMPTEEPDKIIEGLYLGSKECGKHAKQLHELNISHVLTVTKFIPPLHPETFAYKVVEVYDVEDEDLKVHFMDCIEFIDKARKNDTGVLVHWYVKKLCNSCIIA